MIEYVDADDLEQAIRDIVADDPDVIYKKVFVGKHSDESSGLSCVYFDSNQAPSCLIGRGLARLGLTFEQLEPYNEQGVQDLFEIGLIKADTGDYYERISWFGQVQSRQDMGFTWKSALELADRDREEDNSLED